ncbi:MAG: DUF6798 domain-containing protein [Elainella sp.]
MPPLEIVSALATCWLSPWMLMDLLHKLPFHLRQIGLQVLALVAFIGLKYLFDDNVGLVNEVDVLPLARQAADPNWIPADWYLNQPPGYRRLFALLFGNLASVSGFLATSILGRLVCYSLVALGLVLIGRRLGLKLPLLITALGLFLYVIPEQGVAAQEWLVKSLEAKAVAYGLLLLAIACLLRQRYQLMALLLGLATSFHVLVGGWATLIVVATLLLKATRQGRPLNLRQFGLGAVIYCAASAFAITPVVAHLFSAPVAGKLAPSFIYVFLRLPHHLNPLSWKPFWWLIPLAYLIVLVASIAVLGQEQRQTRQQTQQQTQQQYQASIDLFQLTLLSLVPFVAGLLLAPFDQQGNWLQFYPFRVGDVLLPLNTCLLLTCAVQYKFAARQQIVQWVCLGLIAITCSIQLATFQTQVASLPQFPAHQDPALEPEFLELADWVKTQTPANALIISSPVELVELSWITERPTLAKYKLLPQTKTKILEWYDRIADLNGGVFPQASSPRTQDVRSETRRSLTEGYSRLTSEQAQALLTKYSAQYLLTRANHQLTLPIAYRNDRYILYRTHLTSLEE